jgi:cytosine/adenosine deaminase-related metal-dependent hydrolase
MRSTAIQNSVIIIECKNTKAIGAIETLDVPENVEVISPEGRLVLPGLPNMYVHAMINIHADYAY